MLIKSEMIRIVCESDLGAGQKLKLVRYIYDGSASALAKFVKKTASSKGKGLESLTQLRSKLHRISGKMDGKIDSVKDKIVELQYLILKAPREEKIIMTKQLQALKNQYHNLQIQQARIDLIKDSPRFVQPPSKYMDADDIKNVQGELKDNLRQTKLRKKYNIEVKAAWR